MSVLIKGMNMPKSCWECDFTSWQTVREGDELKTFVVCDFDGHEHCPLNERHKDCPLVEVQASPFDKKDELESLERIKSGKGLLPIVRALED